MRNRVGRRNNRVLAIAPSSRGFGYAVLEGGKTLVDWGVRSITGAKNAGSMNQAESMMALYKPAVLVLPDAFAEGSRRFPRIRDLSKHIAAAASNRKIRVVLLSRDQVMRAFLEDGQGTKHTIARILAVRFPMELGHRLPPKRRAWMGEDYRTGIFDAVALAMTCILHKPRQNCEI